MANYPQALAQDAVCQSHTDHMTGFWFLPARPLRLNTNDDNDSATHKSTARLSTQCIYVLRIIPKANEICVPTEH